MMMKNSAARRLTRTAGIGTLLSVAAISSGFAASAADQAACTPARLSALAASPLHIDSVTHVDATSVVPAHCAVLGHIEHGTRIGFKLGLPDDWNGKYLFIGIGGFAGQLDPIEPGLAKGYATATSDTGHSGTSVQDATWALNNPLAVLNHFESGTALPARALKELTTAHYARVPAHAFFYGCSAGGRQGIVEAERFPETFDGIVAGAPAWNYTKLLISFVENGNTILQSPANWIPPELFEQIDREVLEQCDASDGLKDGILTDPRRCQPDLSRLRCRSGEKPAACMTAAQLATLKHLMRPGFANGQPGYFGYRLSGSDRDVGPSWGWPKWFFGTKPPVLDRNGKLAFRGDALPEGADRGVGPNQFLLGEQFLRYLVKNDPGYDARTFSMRTDAPALERKFGRLLDAEQTDIGPFIRSGGKLLIWHGWADPAIPPEMSIDLYQRIQRATRAFPGQTATADAVRLFLIPGVQHCGGGAGLTDFDSLGALENWVEQGHAPSQLIASQHLEGQPARSRPVCAYPKTARYQGHGNPDEAASFSCQ